MKLVQVCHDSSKTGEGRLAYFSSKCSTIIPLLKEYFPFSQVELFGYDNAPHDGICQIFSNFHISPKIRGRGEESNRGILKLHHASNCS